MNWFKLSFTSGHTAKILAPDKQSAQDFGMFQIECEPVSFGQLVGVDKCHKQTLTTVTLDSTE